MWQIAPSKLILSYRPLLIACEFLHKRAQGVQAVLKPFSQVPHQGDFPGQHKGVSAIFSGCRAFSFTEALKLNEALLCRPSLKFHIFVLIIKANITLQSKTLRFGVQGWKFQQFPLLKGGDQVSGLQEDILIVWSSHVTEGAAKRGSEVAVSGESA